MQWSHFIKIDDAKWISDNDIIEVSLKIVDTTFETKLVAKDGVFIYLRPLVLWSKEVILNPSNHSLVTLSEMVAFDLWRHDNES